MGIKVDDIAYVKFRAPDLDRMRGFLEDFGLRCADQARDRLFMRGYGTAPFAHWTERGEAGFAEVGFRARDEADVEALAKSEDAKVETLDAPGGGSCVRLTGPEGIAVAVVAGQTRAAAETFEARAPWNGAEAAPRLRTTKRVAAGPAHVVRLGHAVFNVKDFRAAETWFKSRLGFITSDEIEAGPGTAIGAFMRCDRGDVPADHHTLFLLQLPQAAGFNHAAFEVRDLDDVMLGHDHLKRKDYKPQWGIGRHVFGSQVFDYWYDPYGHVLEHWTDGDLLVAGDGSRISPVADLLAVQWGAKHPSQA